MPDDELDVILALTMLGVVGLVHVIAIGWTLWGAA